MIITFPKSKNLTEGDLIALTKNNKFIGYGEVMAVLKESILVNVDKSASKVFNEIFYENIPYNFEIANDM
ncbi:MAG: hypothetical protein N2645_14020 [Clostridia bacterium]|nr:hypothetical protein [Clostridia bacterium]